MIGKETLKMKLWVVTWNWGWDSYTAIVNVPDAADAVRLAQEHNNNRYPFSQGGEWAVKEFVPVEGICLSNLRMG
jgi:hypothetical protein